MGKIHALLPQKPHDSLSSLEKKSLLYFCEDMFSEEKMRNGLNMEYRYNLPYLYEDMVHASCCCVEMSCVPLSLLPRFCCTAQGNAQTNSEADLPLLSGYLYSSNPEVQTTLKRAAVFHQKQRLSH